MKFKKEVKKAKRSFYKDKIKDLKESNPRQWYSKLKRLCSYDQNKSDPIIVETIKHLSDKEQVELIADKFAKTSQEYDPLKKDDINIPDYDISSVPIILPSKVKSTLESIKINKSSPPGDVPPKLIKEFASELSVPFCEIINSSIKLGQWPDLYKREYVTPVPKVYPPHDINDLRNISGLLNFDKVAEKIIAELMIEDMSIFLDPSQYANQKGLSLQHYLINMINKILTDTDNNSKGEVNAIIATLVDWKEAFPRQCPKLGIEAFIKCGVRPSLIPLIIKSFKKDL